MSQPGSAAPVNLHWLSILQSDFDSWVLVKESTGFGVAIEDYVNLRIVL